MDSQSSSLNGKPKAAGLVIPVLLAWIMAITGFLFPFVLFLLPVEKWSNYPGMFGACLSAMLVIWIIFLVDIITSKIRDKSFWVLAIIVMPTVAQLFYVSRKKHILISDNSYQA